MQRQTTLAAKIWAGFGGPAYVIGLAGALVRCAWQIAVARVQVVSLFQTVLTRLSIVSANAGLNLVMHLTKSSSPNHVVPLCRTKVGLVDWKMLMFQNLQVAAALQWVNLYLLAPRALPDSKDHLRALHAADAE